MKLPWVSRRAYELLSQVAEEWRAEYDETKAELDKEREANRNLMASALALRNLGNPYRPANITAPPAPIGKSKAAARIRELEEADRLKAKELADAAARANEPAAPVN